MAVTMQLSIDREECGIRIQVAGHKPDGLYELRREYRWWPGDPKVVTERVIRLSPNRGATISNNQMRDPLAPFNTEITYKLYETTNQKDFTLVATEGPIVLDWIRHSDDPFDWRNDRPIFRDPFQVDPYDPDLPSVTRPYARVVVTDFTAEWPVRGESRISIIGSKYPRMVTDQRELKQGTMQILTAPYRRLPPGATPPFDDADFIEVSAAMQRMNLLNLFQTTRILHLRGYCVDGMQDLFLVITNIKESIPNPWQPEVRLWDLEFQQVRNPGTYWQKRWDFDTSYTLVAQTFDGYTVDQNGKRSVLASFVDYSTMATTDLAPPTGPLRGEDVADPFVGARL
jgi:hypothetical protein